MKIPFNTATAELLTVLGYKPIHVPASWEDVGTAESGPKLTGCDAYDAWEKDHTSIIVVDGHIVDIDVCPPNPHDTL